MVALSALVSGLDAELVRLGYKDSTMVWYRGCWRRLQKYFAARGAEEFSLDLAMAWVDEACGFFAKEQAGTLSQFPYPSARSSRPASASALLATGRCTARPTARTTGRVIPAVAAAARKLSRQFGCPGSPRLAYIAGSQAGKSMSCTPGEVSRTSRRIGSPC